MRSRSRAIGVVVLLSLLSLFLTLPEAARSQSPTPTDSPSPDASPTGTESPSPDASGSPSPAGSPTPAPEPEKPGRSTDTEYLKVQIDRTGQPVAAWLKDWLRLRGRGSRTVSDPATFVDVNYLGGTKGARESATALSWDVSIGKEGFKDIYYEGRLQQQGDYWLTPDGPKPLPINVLVRYFTGDEGAEEEVTPQELEATTQATRFKIVVTLTNMTKREQEIAYTDIQTKKAVVAVAPVYTPYVARIVDMRLPDGDFDSIRSDGDMTRTGRETIINWTRNLVPPDFPAEQDAIITGVIAKGARLPKITVVAQPVFPPLDAEALTSEGIQFQRGRRNFMYDVFGLFRENLIALTALFGLLHDAFGNLSIPILGPDKGNREAGSFDNPNQLWALWTLTKGMEQADRALNVIQNAVELSRDATKGALSVTQVLRLLVGYSSDTSSGSVGAVLGGLDDPNTLLLDSIWSDVKGLAQLCGDTGWSTEERPYFPDAPALVTPLCPTAELPLNLMALKLAIAEHDFHSLQKQNHELDTALIPGISNLPSAGCGADVDTAAGQSCNSWNKYLFIKFPFGLEELERGLHTLKTKGFDPLQAALGNKETPNSLIWALHVLTDGAEAQVDAFHQLGATWRFIADSIQNFAIFGIETARNLLQWDINAIDIDTAVKAASVARAKEMATFMGRPIDKDGEPAVGQLVITFSTDALNEHPMATDTPMGRASVLLASGLILAVVFGFARFRWFVV
ncbi:MAG: hypothetical protein ACRDKS_01165 [Actinomycetota bacterium]